MNFWLTTFLISLHKEGVDWRIEARHHVHSSAACLAWKPAPPPQGDWFRRLVATQANVKIIFFIMRCVHEAWEVIYVIPGSLSITVRRNVSTKARGRSVCDMWHMINGGEWRRTDDLACTTTKDYSWMNLKHLKVQWIPLHCRQHITDWWSTKLFMQTPEKHASHQISGILLCCCEYQLAPCARQSRAKRMPILKHLYFHKNSLYFVSNISVLPFINSANFRRDYKQRLLKVFLACVADRE